MKRSAAVVLIGMGAAALAACGKHDDCKDKDPNSQACQASHTSGGGHGGGAGGWFYGSSSSSTAEADVGTVRGGIGATGEGHASAGGEGGGGHGGGGGE